MGRKGESGTKLEPGERSILATFGQDIAAQEAEQELRAAGFNQVGLDRTGAFGYDPRADGDLPAISGKTSSLAKLTLSPSQLGDESRVLMAAMPEASGMAGSPTQLTQPFLLTVVTNDQGYAQAADIIARHGGRV
ncbi:MAG: hypothetical protein ACM3XM_21445 [Mycobacterium leprae]